MCLVGRSQRGSPVVCMERKSPQNTAACVFPWGGSKHSSRSLC